MGRSKTGRPVTRSPPFGRQAMRPGDFIGH
jgi:hypothetical protein